MIDAGDFDMVMVLHVQLRCERVPEHVFERGARLAVNQQRRSVLVRHGDTHGVLYAIALKRGRSVPVRTHMVQDSVTAPTESSPVTHHCPGKQGIQSVRCAARRLVVGRVRGGQLYVHCSHGEDTMRKRGHNTCLLQHRQHRPGHRPGAVPVNWTRRTLCIE